MVGGPQYRVGSHRQFTLLARHLAAQGFTSLRFDYSGMGDSEGVRARFDNVREDVEAALDALLAAAPGVRRVVL
ncbi:MAG: hydrolase 1, exosortase A system-associated, partial [Halioglobus sp.]|nr:hydrolase 1, exosortase A system-associated [Halioglobus sp.]